MSRLVLQGYRWGGGVTDRHIHALGERSRCEYTVVRTAVEVKVETSTLDIPVDNEQNPWSA